MFHLVDFCRLCLTFEGEFSDMCIDNTIEKVTACIRDLEFEDHLPTLICTKCSEQLDKYFEFRNRCLVSEFLLNNYVEKFLVDSKTSEFTNTKLQVNILKNCATTNKSLGNVKLRRNSNSNEPSQKKCKVVLKNIRNFVGLKNTCKVQEFCDKSNKVSCELQDFEDFFNTNRSDYVHSEVSNVSDCEAFINSSIFSDDDDVFLEEEDEIDTQPKSPTEIIAAKHDYDQSTSAKRKISVSEGFNKKCKIDQNLNPGILTDITERVKLRKRQVQRVQTINYSELSSENVHKTKKREAPKSPKPCKLIQENTLKNTTYTLTNDNIQHLHNKQKAATSESTIPAVNKLANDSSINQLICGTVSDNLGPKLDQISKNRITTATNFEAEIERANINWSTASYVEGCDWSQKQNEINADKEVINLENETNKSTALNMGIVRIDQNQQDLSSSSKKIATVTDYEENIATHCIMPVQIQDNNENPDTTIQSNESTQQLYQANFGNLLKYHITNVKKGHDNKKVTYKVLMSSNKKPVKIILPVRNAINAPKQLHATNTQQNMEPLNSRFVLNYSEDKILLPPSPAKSNNLQVSLLKKRLTASNTSVDKLIQKPTLSKKSENRTDLNIPLVPLETIKKKQRFILPRLPTIKVVDMSVLIDNTKPLPPFFEHKTEQNAICQQIQPVCIDTLKDEKSIPESKNLSNDLETIPTLTSHVNEASNTLMKVENQINLFTESHASTCAINSDTCEDSGITDIVSNNELCQSQVEQIMPANIEDSHHAKKPFTSIKRNADSAYKYMQAKRIKKKRQYNKDKFVIDDPLNILTLLKKKRRKPEGAKNLKKRWPTFVNAKQSAKKRSLCVDKQNTGANLNIDTSQEDLNPTSNENELNISDSENSEIDVVTVFSEKRNSGTRMDQKAFSERIRRNEGRSLIMHLCGLIPEFTSKSVIPVQAVLNSAKKYIKTLQYESRRLEEERIRLLGEKTKFTAILQGLKDNVDINVCD